MTTELLISKVAGVTAAVQFCSVAVIDTAIQKDLIGLGTLIVLSTTGLLTTWIAYKTKAIDKKQRELSEQQSSIVKTVEQLEKNTNGINKALLESTASENKAVGIAEGVQKAEAKADTIAAAKAEGVAQEKAAQVVTEKTNE